MSEQALIWEYYQNRRPESFSWGRTRLDWLLRRVRSLTGPSPARVFTVGAGEGHLERGLVRLGHAVTSLDLDAATAERMNRAGVRGLQGELHRFDGSGGPYDVAVASEVLEHIPEQDLLESVRAVHDCLRPGGTFLATVPFREDLSRSTTVCPGCGHEHHIWGHVQSFDAQRLEDLFLSAGFEHVTVSGHFFARYRQLNWGGRLTFAAKHLAWLLFRRPSSSMKYLVEAVRP